MTGGGSRSDSGSGSDPGERRRSGSSSWGAAIDACQDAVSERIASEYRYSDVAIQNARADNGTGRSDYIVGEAIARRGRSTVAFSFVCHVDFSSGRVRSVDVKGR